MPLPVGSAPCDDRQVDLFAHPVVLARELEAALGRGRFEEAAGLRRVLSDAYGPSRHTVDLAFLERLGGPVWQRPPVEVLAVWTEIDGELRERVHLRARLREGVFRRLLESQSAEALVTAAPECLSALAVVLASGVGTTPDAGRRRARGLVREALLAGRGLESLDFKEDGVLARASWVCAGDPDRVTFRIVIRVFPGGAGTTAPRRARER